MFGSAVADRSSGQFEGRVSGRYPTGLPDAPWLQSGGPACSKGRPRSAEQMVSGILLLCGRSVPDCLYGTASIG